jgi:hypothetical protein
MRTVDRLLMRAPVDRVFRAAMDVEQWPVVVEMAAWRPFGPLKYPTWWVSEMWIDPNDGVVRYRHVRGITSGMEVQWQLHPVERGTEVTIVHDWRGPSWPLIGPAAASLVIGPVFIHGIASRTLAGIARHVEG